MFLLPLDKDLTACGQIFYCLWTSTGNKPSVHSVFLLPVDEILIACGRISSPTVGDLIDVSWLKKPLQKCSNFQFPGR